MRSFVMAILGSPPIGGLLYEELRLLRFIFHALCLLLGAILVMGGGTCTLSTGLQLIYGLFQKNEGISHLVSIIPFAVLSVLILMGGLGLVRYAWRMIRRKNQ